MCRGHHDGRPRSHRLPGRHLCRSMDAACDAPRMAGAFSVTTHLCVHVRQGQLDRAVSPHIGWDTVALRCPDVRCQTHQSSGKARAGLDGRVGPCLIDRGICSYQVVGDVIFSGDRLRHACCIDCLLQLQLYSAVRGGAGGVSIRRKGPAGYEARVLPVSPPSSHKTGCVGFTAANTPVQDNKDRLR